MEGLDGGAALIFIIGLPFLLVFNGSTIISVVGGFVIGFLIMPKSFRYVALVICLVLNEAYLLLRYGDEYTHFPRVVSTIFVMLLCFWIGYLVGESVGKRSDRSAE